MNVNWWQARKDELLILAEKQCPLYVYNEETLNDSFFDLLALNSLEGLFYPIAANTHPKIRQKAFDMGLGFLCTSTEELKGLLDQFPQIDLRRLVFLYDNSGPIGSHQALKHIDHLVIKNPAIFEPNLDVFKGKGFYLFLDNEPESNPDQWPEKGLMGFYINQNTIFSSSNNLDRTLSFLTKLSGTFPKTSVLILGNGAGVEEYQEKKGPDIRDLDYLIEVIHDTCPQFNLWLEMPLNIISFIGILLIKVLETGVTKGERYIRINMEMKASMRKKIFGGCCQIINLSKSGKEESIMTRVMGQNKVSETSSDIIKIPSSSEAGNVLLVSNMGAQKSWETPDKQDRDSVPEHYLSARRICQVKI